VSHVPNLIQDLALILAVAGVATVLCKILKQPTVLGYILAGFMIGPNFKLFPSITDTASIHTWGEIGVIFLLFGLGLEFSFKKLIKVGPSALITAGVQITVMLILGFLTGEFLGWGTINGFFLGGILAISSTTIIIRAVDELNLKGRKFVSLVFGALIVEDLVAVLLLVALSTLAIQQTFSGTVLLTKAAQLGFFMCLWFVAGIFVLPTLLRKARRFFTDEILLIVSLSLCLLMVMASSAVGFSSALGAFVMGSLLAETHEAERIEKVFQPVKDLFAAVFFVSVGMLIAPDILVNEYKSILLITGVLFVGKIFSTTLGALIAGKSLRHATQTGMSLAQIGEFSFIIAGLGQTLKVTNESLYPVTVGVSAISTLATPFLIRSSDKTVLFLERILPKRFLSFIERYSSVTQKSAFVPQWRSILWSRVLRMLLNSVIVIAIVLLTTKFLRPHVFALLGYNFWTQMLVALCAFALSAPFLWAVAFGGKDHEPVGDIVDYAKSFGPFVLLSVLRVLFTIVLLWVFLTSLVSFSLSLLFIVGLIVVGLYLFRSGLSPVYAQFENRFLSNLSAREREAAEKKKMPPLAPWDAHIAFFHIPQSSVCVGQSLEELAVRERFGVSIALIERGEKQITAPSKDARLYPSDTLGVIGTDDELAAFNSYLQSRENIPENGDSSQHNYVLRPVLLKSGSPFIGKIIRDSGLREKVSGLVVGVERNGERMLNPASSFELRENDLLWIVGNEKKIEELS
jgi:CPA2 family monovalent cation:H+ antiporter-2